MSFTSAKFPVTRTATPRTRPADSALKFGAVFADHMLLLDYKDGAGWGNGRIVPYAPIAMDPAAAGIHYGQSLFDGLKAYRGQDGKIRIFRLPRHCARLAEGAKRLSMPDIDPELAAEAIKAIVSADQDWIPSSPGTALYIRPTVFATDAFLGVRPAKQYEFFVFTSPVGAYYAEGFGPVSIRIEDRYVRAAPGGLGAVKASANYMASLMAAEEAKAAGFAQVLWTDAIEHSALEEVGTMNLFVRIGDEVVTPPLTGTILPGVTRASVIDLLRAWGITVNERRITVDELLAAQRNGLLGEVFGTGTAAVISPVGELGWKNERFSVAGGIPGELSQRLFKAITDIQYGRAEDTFGWITEI
jgi:branched-chain amino acid aminotransferase